MDTKPEGMTVELLEEIDRLMDEHYKILADAYRKEYESKHYINSVEPTFILVKTSGEPVVRRPPKDKDFAVFMHRMMAWDEDIATVALVDEAWRADLSAMTEEERQPYATGKVRLEGSDIPKTEVLMINLRCLDEQRVGFCKIDRLARTLAPEPLINPKKMEAGHSVVGRMV